MASINSMSALNAGAGPSGKTPGEGLTAHVESEAKRRKVRKGTHSCWECKRRKMKCKFSAPSDTNCIDCQRRGAKCVSQEFPDRVSATSQHLDKEGQKQRQTQIGYRVVRVDAVEALVEQLIEKAVAGRATPGEGRQTPGLNPAILTPASIGSELPQRKDWDITPGSNARVDHDIRDSYSGHYKPGSSSDAAVGQAKYERLSRALHKSLPSREDTKVLWKTHGHKFILLVRSMLTIPYTTFSQDGRPGETLLEIPGTNAHPVLIARHMLQVATFLQHLHPDVHDEIKGLSEPPQAMMKRLAETAINLVTKDEEILGNIEGLECLMMESLYQASCGNLRRGWMAVRKAMAVAQLMGLDRSQANNCAHYPVLDPNTKARPQLMWFRIVFQDRHLCLMLGLTQGSLDHSMAADAVLAADTPTGRLERIHCVVASRILVRNQSDPSSRDSDGALDFILTEDLDMDLQKAARGLPSKWWLAPNLASSMDNSETLFWDMRRLFGQLFHYSLLNQLHLPYMLRASAERKYDYSRIACVNASREILSRFIMFRRFNRSVFCCRNVDFFALMAALTLLLAHLDCRRSSRAKADNLLAHQYLSDRAMMEQAQESMEEVSRLNTDALCMQSSILLRQLLAIDAEAAEDYPNGAKTVTVSVQGQVEEQTSEFETTQPGGQLKTGVVRVHVPYFGIIKIANAHKGVISKELPGPQHSVPVDAASGDKDQPPSMRKSGIIASRTTEAEIIAPSPRFTCTNEFPSVQGNAPVQAGGNHAKQPPTMQRAQARPDDYAKTYTQQLEELPVPCADSDIAVTHLAPQLHAGPGTLLHRWGDPMLTAGLDDWAFQGVDSAFFDSLMRGTGGEESDDTPWATLGWQNES